MTRVTSDLFYLVSVTIVMLLDHFVFFGVFQRRVQRQPGPSRLLYWSLWMILMWGLVGAGMVLWSRAARPWQLLGFNKMEAAGGWVASALILALAIVQGQGVFKVAHSAKARAAVRKQFAALETILPHNGIELLAFFAVSLTAGFCEEFIFRGYLIRFLQPSLGWLGAASFSLLAFALGHSYQGSGGLVRTAILGAIMTLVFWVSGSLWPAIVLHTLIDIGSGLIAWFVLREAK